MIFINQSRLSFNIKLSILVALNVCSLTLQANAEEFLGARTIVEKANKIYQSASSQKYRKEDNLKEEILKFRSLKNRLPLQKAAQRWLKLIDQYWSDVSSEYFRRNFNRGEIGFRNLLEVIPGPDSWKHLENLLEKRARKGPNKLQNYTLQLLIHFFNNDQDAQKQDLHEIKRILNQPADKENFNLSYLEPQIKELETSLDLYHDESKNLIAKFEKQLENPHPSLKEELRFIEVPDLITLAGHPKAQELLTKALTLPEIFFRIRQGEDTLRLAQTLALGHIDQLAIPQWGLVTTLDSVQLYEALDKKFPSKGGNTEELKSTSNNTQEGSPEYSMSEDSFIKRLIGEKKRAGSFYLLGLIAQNRIEDAKNFVERVLKKTSYKESSVKK